MRSFLPALLAAASLLSCQDAAPGTAPTAAATSTGAAATAPSPDRRISFSLQDADSESMLQAMAASLDAPVVVEARAAQAFAAARLTVFTPGPVERDEVRSLIDAALQPQGLAVRAVGAGYLISPAAKDASAPSKLTEFRFALPPNVPQADAAQLAIAGIRVVSPTEREIAESTRALFVAQLRETLLGARSARFVHEDQASFRVFGVRADSLLARLGLENGDRHSLGAGSDASAASVLQALAGLKQGVAATVGIERRGRPLELRYRVVP
ncbi:MAG: hypothetical protein WKG00_03500 [Polyangiaceae bacterium]